MPLYSIENTFEASGDHTDLATRSTMLGGGGIGDGETGVGIEYAEDWRDNPELPRILDSPERRDICVGVCGGVGSLIEGVVGVSAPDCAPILVSDVVDNRPESRKTCDGGFDMTKEDGLEALDVGIERCESRTLPADA